MQDIKIDWGFVGDNLPNYYSRDDVLLSDILAKYVDGELEDKDDLAMIKRDYSNDMQTVQSNLRELDARLYTEAYHAFILKPGNLKKLLGECDRKEGADVAEEHLKSLGFVEPCGWCTNDVKLCGFNGGDDSYEIIETAMSSDYVTETINTAIAEECRERNLPEISND